MQAEISKHWRCVFVKKVRQFYLRFQCIILIIIVESNGNYNFLQYTPNLCSLTLSDISQMPRDSRHSPVAVIQALFSPLLSSNGNRFPLQHFSIYLFIHDPTKTKHWPEWHLIDTLLAKPEFAPLERVNINIRLSMIEDGCSTREFLSGQLPYLKESGKLSVKVKA